MHHFPLQSLYNQLLLTYPRTVLYARKPLHDGLHAVSALKVLAVQASADCAEVGLAGGLL